MNFLRDNKIQKLSACFLLTVFIFINAVKTFHTHALTYSAHQENSNRDTTAFKAYFFCTICDFQFSRDSDAEVAAIPITTPVYAVASFHTYILPTVTSFISTSSVRGPPAFLS
jgi:hypothetical protein